MKKGILLAICMASFWSLSAQDITVSSEYNDKGEVIISATNSSHKPYTVILTLKEVSNTNMMPGDSRSVLVSPGMKELLTLRPTTSGPIRYSYRYTFRKGDARAKVDTTFTYLFPIAKGKKVHITRLTSVGDMNKKVEDRNLVGLAFGTQEGDTVSAARAGLVTEILDNSASTSKQTLFNATENYVEVCHKDGSFATYKLFVNEGIFVKPGDTVLPGQPIGIAGGGNHQNGSHIRFILYSPVEKDSSFLPCFYLGEGKTGQPEFRSTYISEHPREYVMLEMSKKERKKFEKESD